MWGGEGHYARDCPSELPISPQSPECHGCHGRCHVKRDCPTVFPHLKGKGKGADAKGGWQHKGWGKGMNGGKGMGGGKGGKGRGKGKGKGKGGKGVYGLDLMGHNSWGGDEYWDPTYDYAIRSVDTTYGRTLAAFGPAPIAISDRFRPIAEEPETTAIAVPIADLNVQRPRKLKKKGRNTLKSKLAHPSVCECCPKPIDKPTDTEEQEIIHHLLPPRRACDGGCRGGRGRVPIWHSTHG